MTESRERDRPIGIFDSGIGGLTVLREVIACLPHEDLIYLGDTARVPYGMRSAATVIRYSVQNTRFLIDQGIKALVVACNTASSVSLDSLREKFPVPVIGVIEPGAWSAARATKTGRVGVIGTEATVQSGTYQSLLRSLLPGVSIAASSCPLFVPLVEEGWTGGPIARAVVGRYLAPLKAARIDTLVLGCTHYPLLKGLIGKYMGKRTVLIDSAIETARDTRSLLHGRGLLRPGRRQGKRRFFVTDSPVRFREVGEVFLGSKIDDITLVDIS